MITRTLLWTLLLVLLWPRPILAGEETVKWALTYPAGDPRILGRAVSQDLQEQNALKLVLQRIKMPPGFQIELHALVPRARHMALAPFSGRLFVGTRGDWVFLVSDDDGDGKSDWTREFLPTLEKNYSNGVCFAPDGTLYIAELQRLMILSGAETFLEGSPVKVALVKAPLVPRGEASPGHGMRTCQIGPDDMIYVTQGQPHNISPRNKIAFYEETGVGAIVRMNRWNGADWEVYAKGIRNSVGMDFNPANGELWFTDNQVDGMGDLIPPGELNRATAPGQSFGFPWYGGGDTLTPPYKNDTPPEGLIFPEVEMDAHAADLGMTFYRSDRFPAFFRGGIFNAQHGSWDRSDPIGARIMFTEVTPEGGAGKTIVFAEGWLDEATGDYLGRPVDVIEDGQGGLFVSDDQAGAIYRITYVGE